MFYDSDFISPYFLETPCPTRVIKLDCNSVDREKLLGLLKTNNRNTKETNKMEAKKCDRCGKLYEKKFDKNDIQLF